MTSSRQSLKQLIISRGGLRVNKQHTELELTEELGAVQTLATGQAGGAVEAIRIEEWNGKQYTVVPVVAIVEGVLQGANAKTPELATAEEFGKFPKSWDGRPVVMNHPQINGVFVSAAIPEVLTDFGMGMIFNTVCEDKKLKCEAWLDHERIQEVGGEMLETLERIKNGDLVDVSVGAWLEVAAKVGTYEGKNYGGKWHSVAPDHLAFLSEGIPGACSVKDGCGVPRLFQQLSVQAAPIGAKVACCDGCAKGEGCDDPNRILAENVPGSAAMRYNTVAVQEIAASIQVTDDDGTPLSVNKLPSGMDFTDAKILVRQSLCELLDVPSYDLETAAMTTSSVVYWVWGTKGLNMLDYSINEDGVVKFSGDAKPVNLLTRIVPRQTNEPSVNQTQENNMPAPNSGGGDQQQQAGTEVTNESTGAPAAGTPAAPQVEAAVPSFDQLLAAASGETRESIEYGQRLFNSHKAALIKGITACGRNKFNEAQLQGFSIDQLEKLAELAEVPSYAGRAIPSEQEGINTNASQPQGMKVAQAPGSYLVAPEAK